jgi:uncharacterized membrane protein YkoI
MTVITGVALAAALAGGGAALATSGDDHAVTGSTADRARAAAVRYAGGRAGSVELDGEHGATYDVEVHQRRGRTVDVWLDNRFAPITSEVDSER